MLQLERKTEIKRWFLRLRRGVFRFSEVKATLLCRQSYAFTCSKQLFCLVKVMLLAGKSYALGCFLTR